MKPLLTVIGFLAAIAVTSPAEAHPFDKEYTPGQKEVLTRIYWDWMTSAMDCLYQYDFECMRQRYLYAHQAAPDEDLHDRAEYLAWEASQAMDKPYDQGYWHMIHALDIAKDGVESTF